MIKRTLGTRHYIWILFVTITMWSIMPLAWAGHIKQHQRIDGLDIYLTVVPAEMIRGHPKEHFEAQMHGGVSTNDHYHIIVTLFDRATGQRITDAEVKAKVISQNYTGPELKLEYMILAGESSYGHYVTVPVNEAFNIDLQIHISGKEEIIKARFIWARA